MNRLAAGLVVGAMALGEPASAAPDPGRLVLSQPAPLAHGVSRLPQITSPRTAATDRINAAMKRIDADGVKTMAECRQSSRTSPSAVPPDYERHTEVTMRGPDFFSLVVTDSYMCGGAHPDDSSLALVYDLDTGRPLNWLSYLPASMKAEASLEGEGASRVGVVTSPVLHDLYVTALRASPDAPEWSECGDALEDAHTLLVWPDAESDGLMVQPSDMPHVVAACAAAASIPTATLRKLGVNARLLDAVDAAHGTMRR